MGNRAAANASAIDASVATAQQNREAWSRPRRGWRYYPHEMEVVDYYNGARVAAAGLHSSLGQQLERMRDGLGSTYGNPCDVPPELRGAVKRTVAVREALERVWALETALRAQYEKEPEGRKEGFGCLVASTDWKKRQLPDLGFKLTGMQRPNLRNAGGEVATDDEPERLTPSVVIVSIVADLGAGRNVGGISVNYRIEGVDGVRLALRSLCLTAAGLAKPGDPAPKKTAVAAARDDLARIGVRAKLLVKRAQSAYAKARAGADAAEVLRFLAEMDGAE